MFAGITTVNDDKLYEIITEKCTQNGTADVERIKFEIGFLKRLLIHAENLLRSIDETAITGVIKKQIIKVTSLLVTSYDTRLNGLLNEIQKELTRHDLDALETMQIMKTSRLNEYTISIGTPKFPSVILSQIGGIPASCGLHAVMHMLLSAGFTSNFFEFCEIHYQRAFAAGFNRLNNGEICTMMSEINDVLRSFADTISSFVPPKKLYSMVSTKGKDKYNFSDFLKPSAKVNYGIQINAPGFHETYKTNKELDIRESLIHDIKMLQPEWVLFDIGMWTCIANGINMTFNASGCAYRLHSFIVNTGYHYICCVVDTINTESGPVTVARVYDDMSPGNVRTTRMNIYDINSIGALLYYRYK